MKSFIRTVSVCALLAWAFTALAYQANYQLINNPAYPSSDLGVATVNVLDQGLDNTGQRDCTAQLQAILDEMGGVDPANRTDRGQNCKNISGGTVYLPAGKYLFKGQLIIPIGVTVRGDWKRPDMTSAAEGTVIVVEPDTYSYDTDRSFMVMQPCTEVSNLTFWYPGQEADNVREMPPTVMFGQNNHWGNEYTTVRHCTFINSYVAVEFNPKAGGGCPNVFDIYGTPLHSGIVMDVIADIGRFDGMHFAPDYWAASGLPGAPARSSIASYLRNNATGVVMRRNDWSFTCNLDVESYKVGYSGEKSVSDNSEPNGHHYNWNIRDCETGIDLKNVSYCGIMFTACNTSGCDTGVRIAYSGLGPAQFYGCRIEGQKAFEMTESSSTFLTLQDCDVNGATHVLAGHFQSVNSTFGSDVFVSAKARCIFTGNKFTNGARLDNNSLFECQVSDIGPDCRPLPDFNKEWMEIRTTRPARETLYVVSGLTPLRIIDDIGSAADCTAAIQNKLNEAGGAGGGIVYLPAGHYRLDGLLRIPRGVEFKGASDVPNVPHGQGTILEVINGHGNENGVPFITMDEGSGLRGMTINYPNQKNAVSPVPYPYSVRGNKDCYIVNVALRAAYRGVDLFTEKCDNHYVDYLGGHAFMNVIRVGGNSTGGSIRNIQFNTIAYACGDETKFGAWPNSIANKASGGDAYFQNPRDLEFFIIGDCSDQILYNNFLFGCNKGMVFQSDGNGGAANCHSVGNAVDDAVNTFVFNGIASDLDLVNSQVVALNHGDNLQATFVTAGPELDHTVTMFSSDHWGGGNYFADVRNGTVNLYGANMNQSGTVHTYSVDGGRLNLVNGIMHNVRNFVSSTNNHERRVHVLSSTLDPANANMAQMGTWTANLSHAWNFVNSSVMLSRDGWKATAFNDVNGTNPVSQEGAGAASAIDGNASTRWDSRGSQAAGQWFAVDLGRPTVFNTVIMDTSGSANDGPAGYTVEVYYDNQWHRVAEGANAGAMLVVTFPEVDATAVRINQTGTKSNYWSIHEFNLANARIDAPSVETGLASVAEDNAFYLAGRTLHIDGNSACNGIVNVFGLQGDMLLSVPAEREVSLDDLGAGTYVAVLYSAGMDPRVIKFCFK